MTIFHCTKGKKHLLMLLLNLAAILWCGERHWSGCSVASAAETAGTPASGGKEHTILAGEEGEATFLGQKITVPAVDRSHLTSLTLGGTVIHPKQGDTPGFPLAVLYLRRITDEYRTRDTISVFVNELEYDKRIGNLELVAHAESYTLLDEFTEVVHGKENDMTSVTWGTAMASLGPGFRIKVSPFNADNDLRLQLLGRVGYMYAEGAHETGPDVVIPPDTMLYGARLRGRYDAMSRNLLELPHRGIAAGFDLDYLHRDKWRTLTPTSSSVNRNFLQVRGYVQGVGGIPGLSEKNRIMGRVNAGTTSTHSADRFNAFTINGGPLPSEADELIRSHYSGAFYDDVRVSKFAIASLGYRRELAFFLYGSLVGSYIWSDRATVDGLDQVVFRKKTAASATVSIDSGFFWNSSLYVAYSWDSSFIRNGKHGSGVTVMWNKMY